MVSTNLAEKSEDADDFSKDKMHLALSEYQSLRDEILRRSDVRFRIVSFFLLIAGTMIGLGLQPKSPSYILFSFPIIGCFLASLWVHNLSWGSRAADFIKREIYGKFKWHPGWEEHEPHSASVLSRTTFSIRGIFIGTQMITILLGLLKFLEKGDQFSKIDVWLAIDAVMLSFAVIASALTWSILRAIKRGTKPSNP